MAALKEIRARIASVGGTLKITSAMKMVASAKLHRVQAASSALTEYERRLSSMTTALCTSPDLKIESPLVLSHEGRKHAVVVAFSSDGSLCGAFNANAVRALAQQVAALRTEGFGSVTVIPVGEKIAHAAMKAGYDVDDRFRTLETDADYDEAAALADFLMEEYISGRADRVVLVYSHFHSMGRQTPVQENFLPMVASPSDVQPDAVSEYICEPEAGKLVAALLPYALRTRLYSVLLDSRTAEHAARTVAMQTATDNATELLDELSLTYNKRRQQAITDELADITPND